MSYGHIGVLRNLSSCTSSIDVRRWVDVCDRVGPASSPGWEWYSVGTASTSMFRQTLISVSRPTVIHEPLTI